MSEEKESYKLLETYVLMTEEEKAEFDKFVQVDWRFRINPEYAKQLVNQMDGCQACGSTWDYIQRGKR